jgi:hypothetical protein
MERVDFKAADGNGGYYKLSAFLDVSADRTKVASESSHNSDRLGFCEFCFCKIVIHYFAGIIELFIMTRRHHAA